MSTSNKDGVNMGERNDYLKFIDEYDAVSLLGQRAMTYADMEHEFGWRRRTAERKIKMLKECFPGAIQAEKLNDGRTAFSLIISKQDLATIISESDITNICNAAKMLSNKELEKLGTKLKNFNRTAGMNADDIIRATGSVSRPGPKTHVNLETVRLLSDAIKLCQRVEMVYTPKDGETRLVTVAPLGWLHGNPKMYLVADKTKNVGSDVRTFLVDNISSLRILDGAENYFNADGFDIDEFASRSFGVWMERPDGFDIEWYVPAEYANDGMRDYTFHKHQNIITNDDGSLTIKFHAGGLLEMSWHLFTWGGKIIPVAPVELVERYQNCIDVAAKSMQKT